MERELAALSTHAAWFRTYQTALQVIESGGIAVLLGLRGTGKTQIAVEISRVMCYKLKPVVYCRMAQMFMAIRASYHRESKMTEEEAILPYILPHLAVFDEVHERKNSDFEHVHGTLVQDMRYGEHRPTIYIGNTDEQTFRKQVGESVWDRIHECGCVEHCNWGSFRRAGL